MLTVVTATYNRAYTLPRLFESLQTQTELNFEWVVVDDGSTDETESLLKDFQVSASFSMKIVKQKNSGKHVAINSGVSVSSGDWIYFVDSDDALPADAVEVFLATLLSDKDSGTIGFCFRRADFSGEVVGRVLEGVPTNASIMTPTAAANFYNGDLAYIFKRTALVKHPFPIFEGEKFVPELLIWNRVSDEGTVKYFGNKTLYLCEYLPDGYSANFNANLRRNPLGFGYFYSKQIAREKTLSRKIKCAVRYAQCRLYHLLGNKGH